jgi:hypothetical protein
LDEDASGNSIVDPSDDQLKKILDVLGPQDERDLAFITEENALTYHHQVARHSKAKCFVKIFPDT